MKFFNKILDKNLNARYNINIFEDGVTMEFKKNGEVSMLILSARDGDNEAFERLVAMYRPMIDSCIRSYSLGIDETFSEACMGFYRAVTTYSLDETNVTFGLYAKICVERCIIDLIRRENKKVSGLVDDGVDVDKIAVSDGIQSMLERREDMMRYLKIAEGVLSSFEFDVCRLWMAGYKTSDIAAMLSSTPKSVDNAKNRMFTKLRANLSDEIK